MPSILAALAPAKINLTLRIVGRRADGFHDLESLVVFAPFGDRLTLRPGGPLGLSVFGPTAGDAGSDRGGWHRRCRQGKAGPTAANAQHRYTHTNHAQLALSAIANFREDFYFDEAFSCAQHEFLSSG